MELVVLGLKNRKDGSYFIYDVSMDGRHVKIGINESKKIKILSPFPFSNYSSLDTVDEKKYEKCYLKVEASLTEKEYSSMKSSGIVYYRFNDREVTLLKEFKDIFQYSLKLLNDFKDSLETYDLTTWVIHNQLNSKNEYEAMKNIIFKAVENKKHNNEFPLDISLDKYTIQYIDYFRNLSNQGYKITFGRYGRNDYDSQTYFNVNLSDENLIYLIQQVGGNCDIFLKHPNFTKDFYENNIKGTKFEFELINQIQDNDNLTLLLDKGLNADALYLKIFNYKLNKIDIEYYGYNSLNDMFNDTKFETRLEHYSPYDYYCCEDCDGYDINELYTEVELEGCSTEVDDQRDIILELVRGWTEYLTSDSYKLFDFISVEVLDKCKDNKFFSAVLESRQHVI